MIVLQIFWFSAIAGAGAYAGIATATSVHDLACKWRRAQRQR